MLTVSTSSQIAWHTRICCPGAGAWIA